MVVSPVKHVEKEPHTQKARGIARIVRDWNLKWAYAPREVAVVQDEAEVAEAWKAFGRSELFARPCPVRPRHGFVESRPVKSPEEALQVFREAKAADPEAEMVLMPVIPAHYNAIITPGGITLGPGNDGATAGKKAITLPFRPGVKTLPHPKWNDLLGEGEVEYLEAVHSGICWTAVQYRSGPPTSGTPDYVPAEVVVKEVFTLRDGMDLLEWEAKAKELASREGLVIYHPNGSLASHYGVHCVAAGLPYITSREPKVGERLMPTSGWTVEDRKALAKAIAGWWAKSTEEDYALGLALGVVHGIAQVLNSKPSEAAIKLLAWGIVSLARYALGASLGELRYSPRRSKLEASLDITLYGASRNDVYKGALAQDLAYTLKALAIARRDFMAGGWGHGFGGRNWAKATGAALGYTKAIARFMAKPGEGQLSSLLKWANRLLHAAHNNGWYLGKWENPTPYNLQNTAAEDPAVLVVYFPEVVYPVATSELPNADPKAMAKEAAEALNSLATGESPAEALVDLLSGKDVDPGKVRKLLEKEEALRYAMELEHVMLMNIGGYEEDDPPDGLIEVYAQHTPLWNAAAHIQVKLPENRGRGYGGVIDVREEKFRQALALVWALSPVRNKPSLNSADDFPHYAPFPRAWWDKEGDAVYIEVRLPISGQSTIVKLWGWD